VEQKFFGDFCCSIKKKKVANASLSVKVGPPTRKSEPHRGGGLRGHRDVSFSDAGERGGWWERRDQQLNLSDAQRYYSLVEAPSRQPEPSSPDHHHFDNPSSTTPQHKLSRQNVRGFLCPEYGLMG
jgi:hypothetical protein